MSTDCQKTTAKAIPATRRVTINDSAHMPLDYSTTPGGTLFSTTPGGTRIIYDRKFLLDCRNSPVTKTPPRGLPIIPGVTTPPDQTDRSEKVPNGEALNNSSITSPGNDDNVDDSQFEMDI